MIKINAAQRLNAGWFSQLDSQEQKRYVGLHPGSKYAETYDNAKDKEPSDRKEADAERVKALRSQIKYLEQDIKEIEADGSDASTEIKHMKTLEHELRDLSKS